MAKARLDKDPEYKAYSQGRKIRLVVQNLLQVTGIDLQNGGRFQNWRNFRNILKNTG
jgi:hypothetical protein